MTIRRRRLLAGAAAVATLLLIGALWWAREHDQRPDPDHRPTLSSVTHGAGARVLVDAAHHEFQTVDGRFAPFASLARTDGFTVASNDRPLTAASLAGVRVLVVANPLGARWPFLPGAASAAFNDGEAGAIEDWVRHGGALLLVADPDPFGAASAGLARRFGVDMRGGRVFDPSHADTLRRSPSWIAYGRDENSLRSHPVTDGLAVGERVRRAVTFTGQSLSVPEGSTPFLSLPASAEELLSDGRTVAASGRAQGVALWHGQGRVIVLADAAMLTAQTTEGGRLRFGFTWPGTDDERLALNALHWLAGVPR